MSLTSLLVNLVSSRIAGILAAIAVMGLVLSRTLEGYKETLLAIDLVNACPSAAETLGEPIRFSFWSLSAGSLGTLLTDNLAPGTLWLSGSKSQGRYTFRIPHGPGLFDWARPTQAVLSCGSHKINVRDCVPEFGHG